MTLFIKYFFSKTFFIFIGLLVGAYLSVSFVNYYFNVETSRDAPLSGEHKSFSFTYDELDRSYDVYVPKSLKKNAPVFFVFHGSYGTSQVMREATGYDFEYLAEENGFLVVYPQGYKNFWNDCRRSADYEANLKNVDDIGYYKQVINFVEKDFEIDKERVIAMGISNGGHMMFKLAYEAPELTLLHVPLVANLPVNANNDCNISNKEVNIIIFNGTNDQINPYDGGLVSLLGNDSRGNVLSSEDTYSYWKNLTSSYKEEFYTFPNTDEYLNSFVTKKESTGSKVVTLYSLVNGGHIYASPNATYSPFFSGNVQDINTAEEIYSVFKRLK